MKPESYGVFSKEDKLRVEEYLRDFLDVGENLFVSKKQLYESYSNWVRINIPDGRPIGKLKFLFLVRRYCPSIKEYHRKDVDGSRIRCYKGLGYKE